jgi:hypothetical protein
MRLPVITAAGAALLLSVLATADTGTSVDTAKRKYARPKVMTVKELSKTRRPTKSHWIEVRAIDANATVISLEVADNLGNSFVVDGDCVTVRRGRARTDGRMTRMNIPIDRRHTNGTAQLKVRAYSIDCNKPRRQSGDQYGNWRNFLVPIGEL